MANSFLSARVSFFKSPKTLLSSSIKPSRWAVKGRGRGEAEGLRQRLIKKGEVKDERKLMHGWSRGSS
jgi:hypothetical protein